MRRFSTHRATERRSAPAGTRRSRRWRPRSYWVDSGARRRCLLCGQVPAAPGFAAARPASSRVDQRSLSCENLFRVGGVTLTLSTSEPTTENIGYHPVVMRDGKLIRTDPRDPMLTNPNPRTLFAWSAAKAWLVAAD